jgi:hypothetical protein
MKFSKFTIAALLLLLSSMIYAQPPYQWVQMVANNQLSVRAILLKDESCPKVSVDNILTAMQLRAPNVANFPAVCELLVSRDTQSIKIQQRVLPTLPREVNRLKQIGFFHLGASLPRLLIRPWR